MKIEEMQDKVGQVVGTSEWILIDQARINAFADCTEDHQFIHVNPEMAKMTPFGTTIAHGFLTLSLMSKMAESAMPKVEALMGLNYGFDKMRFLNPVKVDQKVRGVFKLLEMSEKRPTQWQQKVEVTVEIEGQDKPALIAEWLTMVFTAA